MGYDSECDTIKHINNVHIIIGILIQELLKRSKLHDNSKLYSPEKDIFDEYTPKLKNTTYGSDEYKLFLKEMGVALKHHYSENSHHPEHFKKFVCNVCFKEFKEIIPMICDVCGYSQFQEEADLSQMNIIDIIEMICDWKAAILRHNDGNMTKSLVINTKRFGLSEQLSSIIGNTIKYFGW